MNRLRFLWVSVLGGVLLLIPQTANAGWMRTYGGESPDAGRCVLPSSDSSYIVLGNTSSFGGLWLLKVDRDGDTVWAHVYEGRGSSLDTALDCGYIITGQRNDSLLLLKTDSEGNLVWSETYSMGLRDAGNSVCPTKNRGYIIAGETWKETSEGALNQDLWLIKTDGRGEEEWSLIRYGESGQEPDEGHDADWGVSVMEASDGGYVVCGTADAWMSFSEGKIWWFKIDSEGSVVWEHTYQDGWRSFGSWIEPTSEGGYIITGGMEDEANGSPAASLLLIKTDSLGEIQWQRVHGGSPMALGCWGEQTSDGGYIATGEYYDRGGGSSSDLWMLKTDEAGDTLWTRVYGGKENDWGYCVREDFDEGYILTGFTESFGAGESDLWLIKTYANGDTLALIEESPVTHQPDWQVTPIGSQIVFRYSDRPDGFHASIFDATGRKVDEIHSPIASGTISWGEEVSAGVYFIVPETEGIIRSQKVVLTR